MLASGNRIYQREPPPPRGGPGVDEPATGVAPAPRAVADPRASPATDPCRVPAWLAALLAAAGLVAVVVAVHYRIAFLGETFAARDNLAMVLPARQFLSESLRAGRLPEWSDLIGIGAPFAANPMNGVAYPIFWLVALLGPVTGSNLIILVHLAIAAMGAAAFAYRQGAGRWGAWLAGAAFVSCGYVAGMPANSNAHLLCWVPWVAWAADRVARPAPASTGPARWRDVALLAAAFALQLVVAEPAHVAISASLVALVVACRAERRLAALGRTAVAIACSLPLAAAAVLPALSLLGWTARSGGVGEAGTAWSLAPLRLFELLWPGMLGPQAGPGSLSTNLARGLADTLGGAGRLNGPSWSFDIFVGIPVLGLGTWAAVRVPRTRWMLAGLCAFLLLALGPATPAYGAFAWLVPPARLARYPEKYLVGALVLGTALAGVGFGRLLAAGADRLLLRLLATGSALLAAALGASLLFRGEIASLATARTLGSLFPVDGAAGLESALESGTGALAAAVLFTALVAAAFRLRLRGAALAAGLAAVGHLAWQGAKLNPTVAPPPSTPPPLLAGLAEGGPPGPRPRVAVEPYRPPGRDFVTADDEGAFTLRSASSNTPSLYGVSAYPGVDELVSGAMARLLRVQGETRGALVPAAWRYAFAGAEYIVVSSRVAPVFQLPTVATDERVGLSTLRVVNARPRAFVASRWRRSPRPLAWIARSATGPDLGEVVLEAQDEAVGGEAGAEPPRPCSVLSERPEVVEMTCDSEQGGYATLLDEDAPGWSATVDGNPVPIVAADTVFRAVAVGPGRHVIVMRYRTPWLRAGIGLATLSWVLWAGVLVATSRSHRARRRPREAAAGAPGGGPAAPLGALVLPG